MGVVEQVLAAEGCRDGQAMGFGEAMKSVARGLGPTGAAGDQKRCFGLRQQRAEAGHVVGSRPGRGDAIGRPVLDLDLRGLHVLGQGEDHRPGPPRGRDVEGAGDHFRDPFGVVDLRRPFGEFAEHAAEIDLLERLAFHHPARDLADEQDHRRRILIGGMYRDAGVGRARRPGDETDARPAGQLAMGFGHVAGAAFVAADDQFEPIGHVVKRVQHRQVTFAGDAKRPLRAMQ